MPVNIPQIDTSGAAKKDIFNKSLFKYDTEKDMYICPAGEVLPHQRDVPERGLELKVYVNFYACRGCKIRDKCTTSSKEPRKVKRWAHEDKIDAMQQRLDDNPDIPVYRNELACAGLQPGTHDDYNRNKRANGSNQPIKAHLASIFAINTFKTSYLSLLTHLNATKLSFRDNANIR
jgi:hypothetical protein